MDTISEYLFHWGLWATLLQVTIVVGVILRVILTRHPPGSSFAWILITLALPYIGFLLYLILGERPVGRLRARRYRHLMTRWRRKVPSFQETALPATLEPYQSLLKLANRCSQMPVTTGNAITLLETPKKSFDAILAAIREARTQIDMAFYIWHAGGREEEVARALLEARRRGVRIRILVDAFGSSSFLKSEACQRFLAAGIMVCNAMPMGILKAFGLQRADIRLHRKLVIVDDELAFTGSLNMIDPAVYPEAKLVGHWIDAMVQIKGPAVHSLRMVFHIDWIIQPDHEHELASLQDLPPIAAQGEATIVAMPSGPLTPTVDINLHVILEAIHGAKRTLILTTPYFVPNESLIDALLNACYRGVQVTIILPKEGNSKTVTYASRRYFDDLLQAGATLSLFTGGLLHTKSICVDGEYVVFGTMNLDNRSLHLNYELMLLIFDKPFLRHFEGLLADYQSQSEVLTLKAWRSRPLSTRLIEGASFLLSPLL